MNNIIPFVHKKDTKSRWVSVDKYKPIGDDIAILLTSNPEKIENGGFLMKNKVYGYHGLEIKLSEFKFWKIDDTYKFKAVQTKK